jgi:hypothetical protein
VGPKIHVVVTAVLDVLLHLHPQLGRVLKSLAKLLGRKGHPRPATIEIIRSVFGSCGYWNNKRRNEEKKVKSGVGAEYKK